MSSGQNPYTAPHAPPTPPVPTESGDLTVVDWLLCIFCGLIGCIVGIVRMIQGNPKGIKMIGLSILFSIIWNVLSFALQMMSRN